jgi:protein TonB
MSDPLRERRRYRRKSVLSELGELVMVMLDSERGLLLNLCAGGISVQTQTRLQPGGVFSVQFHLPLTQLCINPTCEAVWANDKCEVGLRILQLAESEKQILGDWVATHCEEPEDALLHSAPVVAPGALAGDAVFAQTAYADLTAAIQALIAPVPLEPSIARGVRPAAAEPVPPQGFLVRVVSQAHSATGADGAALVLRGEEGVICRASSGNAPAVGSRLRADSGLSGECFRLGQVVLCQDAENDSRVNSAVAARLQSRSILIVPIFGNGTTRGILQVLSSRPSAFNPAHIATLEHLAGLVASFLVEERAQQPEFTPEISSVPPAAVSIESAPAAVEPKVEEIIQPAETAPELFSEPPVAAPIEAMPAVEPKVEEIVVAAEIASEPLSEPAAAAPIESAPAAVEPTMEQVVQPAEIAPEVLSELPAVEPVEAAPAAVESEVEEIAEVAEIAPEVFSELPWAAPIEAAQSVENEVAVAPAVQVTPEEPVAEAAQEAEIAVVVPEVLPAAIFGRNFPTRARSYVALIGGLALLIVALLAVVYVPQSNRAAQRTGNPQQAVAMPLPVEPPAASQPKPIENTGEVEKNPPAAPVPEPLHHDIAAPPSRPQPERREAPRPAPPIISAPAAPLHSDMTAGTNPALAENNPALSTRELPPSLHPPDAGKPAAMAAILGAPAPAPVLAAPSRPVRVSEGVVRGRAISQPKPVYPPAALRAGIQGSVVLSATIGTDGAIKTVEVIRGNAFLKEAAVEAVKKWRYQPYYLNGVPVEIESTITLNFKLP